MTASNTQGTPATLYGLSRCESVKSARRWLNAATVDYHFHDYHKAGLERSTLERFVREFGWSELLNRRGTTWRRLTESQRSNLDEKKALALMLAHPALIKRPILDQGNRMLLGFSEADYQALFN